ncbi:MAG: hypothetical protein AB7G28_09275 [Pirellulales bacterium]
MANDDETNRLLREICDLLAKREQQYRDHLTRVEDAYASQLKSTRQRALRWAAVQWVALFFMIFFAVYFALVCANAT